VVVKHQGKQYKVDLEPNTTGEVFKSQLYSLTGVEPERQKILVKGGQLKDSTELSTLALKPGHVFMMMGTPSSASGGGSGALQPPKEKVRFIEDMSEAEAAKAAGALPAGLQNLGNTCYLNSALQTLRAVPELQQELMRYEPPGGRGTGMGGGGSSSSNFSQLAGPSQLTSFLRDLYKHMSETQDSIPPIMFLNTLRALHPQFAQKSRNDMGYAQQDAEEAWSQIISDLRQTLKLDAAAASTTDAQSTAAAGQAPTEQQQQQQQQDRIAFIDKYFAGRFETLTECDEPAAREAGEEAVRGEETFLKLDCHISAQTHHLRDGLLAGLEEQLGKHSAALQRGVTYTKRSRVARLPKYLAVHFIRFFWKRQAQKKAKILKKVSFPVQHELDALEFCTDALRRRVAPVRDRLRELRKDEQDFQRAQKRRKRQRQDEEESAAVQGGSGSGSGGAGGAAARRSKANKDGGDPAADADGKETAAAGVGKAGGAGGRDVEMKDAAAAMTYKTDAEREAEHAAAIARAKAEILELVDPELAADDGANQTGLYELRAVITHQGASADSGHYTAYVKQEAPNDYDDITSGGSGSSGDSKWWWFNDDRVTEVDSDKIEGLSGGGLLFFHPFSLPFF
jgi:ubiquitin carboxyl-terminal hydrolase 14